MTVEEAIWITAGIGMLCIAGSYAAYKLWPVFERMIK